MNANLNRRRFVRIFFGSFIPTPRKSIIWLDHDLFVVEHGCLSCAAQRQPDQSWDLEFSVYFRTRIMPGMEEETRMNPTEVLRQRLVLAGIPTEFGGHPIYKSLVGRVPAHTTPDNLLRRMRLVCSESPDTELGCSIPE